MSPAVPKTKLIALALQGGGSHGAFTWGVLDRLLEDERIRIAGISGTSAGAINAAVLAHGYETNGRDGARKKLSDFWKGISQKGAFSPYYSGILNPLGADWSPLATGFDLFTQFFSPYQTNPFNINPLRNILAETIDFDRLQRCGKIRLFISATNVNTNHLHIFTNEQISLDVLLASSCLPHVNQAVPISGDYFWDGGFMGNPALEPLVCQCEVADIVIVQINPTIRRDLPRHAVDIADRINEITFNSNLMREVSFYVNITQMIEKGLINDPRIERIYFHIIPITQELAHLGVRSKMDTSWTLISSLFAAGRKQAEKWLANHFDDLGLRTTLNLAEWMPTRELKPD
ncbi:MAG TPA: patatin-like phospholipase family protein [Smithellaceae bacterium]|nr:patatin-like phospholipase family protein [Smithellaceae bacterium]